MCEVALTSRPCIERSRQADDWLVGALRISSSSWANACARRGAPHQAPPTGQPPTGGGAEGEVGLRAAMPLKAGLHRRKERL